MTNSSSTRTDFYCCEYSAQVGEQLCGTATRADVWLAVEYTLPWGRDAFAESSLPERVKQWMDDQLAAIPRSRLQLIRQPGAGSKAGYAFYVAVASEQNPTLSKIHLDRYEDLLALDLAAIVSGDSVYMQYRVERPIFLVCANGKRDISCAKYGRPVFETLSKIAGESAWQCTHIGGHRFAATSVFLPHGACYGRIPENEVAAVLEDYREGRIYLPSFRGRSCYDEAVQAADYFLRQETDMRGMFDLKLVSAENNADDWRITFEASLTGSHHIVRLSQFTSEFPIMKNSSDARGAPGVQFRLVEAHSH